MTRYLASVSSEITTFVFQISIWVVGFLVLVLIQIVMRLTLVFLVLAEHEIVSHAGIISMNGNLWVWPHYLLFSVLKLFELMACWNVWFRFYNFGSWFCLFEAILFGSVVWTLFRFMWLYTVRALFHEAMNLKLVECYRCLCLYVCDHKIESESRSTPKISFDYLESLNLALGPSDWRLGFEIIYATWNLVGGFCFIS